MREVDLEGWLRDRHRPLLRHVRLLTRSIPDGWCLVGGFMVMTALAEHGSHGRSNTTKDVDIVADVFARPGLIGRIAHELVAVGLQPAEAFPGADTAHCTYRGDSGVLIDVLGPDGAGDAELEVEPGRSSIAIPGGSRALALSVPTTLYFGTDDYVDVSMPTLSGALVVKAANLLDPRTADQPRHRDDLVDLLGAVDPYRVADDLEAVDRELLAAAIRPLKERLRSVGPGLRNDTISALELIVR